MILIDEIKVKLASANISHYRAKGYNIPIGKDKKGRDRVIKEQPIIVKVKDLPRTANIKIPVKCEDCGSERLIQYSTINARKNSKYLETGETLCSDCANSRMSGENSPVYKHGNILYPQYRNNARRRNIEFELSVKEFESLIPGECYYCGEESKGIDRVSSSKGYFIANCVSCCSQCNFIKNNTPQDLFVKKIKAMYKTFLKNGL